MILGYQTLISYNKTGLEYYKQSFIHFVLVDSSLFFAHLDTPLSNENPRLFRFIGERHTSWNGWDWGSDFAGVVDLLLCSQN